MKICLPKVAFKIYSSPAPPIPADPIAKTRIGIEVRNCAGPLNATAKFWSPATQSWQMTHLKGITNGRQTFKNADGSDVTTTQGTVYFFVRDVTSGNPVPLKGLERATFPGGEVTYGKSKPNLVVACNAG